MQVSVLRIELRFGDCRTVRQKRRRLRAIIAKLRRHFNVSLAEVEREDSATETVLGAVTVARNRREAREELDHVADALAGYPHAEVVAQRLVDV